MARILLDTEDLMVTAEHLGAISGELANVLVRLPGDALTIMAPAVAAEVAVAVAAATAGVGRVSAQLAGQALDLRRRAVFAAVEESGDARLGGGLSLGRGRFGPFGVPGLLDGLVLPGNGRVHLSPFPGPRLAPLAGRGSGLPTPMPLRVLWPALDELHSVAGTGAFFADHIGLMKLTTIERAPLLLRSSQRYLVPFEKWGGGKVLGGAFTAVSMYENARLAADETGGATADGRELAVRSSLAADALMTWKPAAAANVISGGALRADLNAASAMGGMGVSEGQRAYQHAFEARRGELDRGDFVRFGYHVAGDTLHGVSHGIDVGLGRWATDADQGQMGPVVQAIAKGENYVIDNAYPVVDSGIHAVSTGAGAVRHAVDSGAKAVGREITSGAGAVSRGLRNLL